MTTFGSRFVGLAIVISMVFSIVMAPFCHKSAGAAGTLSIDVCTQDGTISLAIPIASVDKTADSMVNDDGGSACSLCRNVTTYSICIASHHRTVVAKLVDVDFVGVVKQSSRLLDVHAPPPPARAPPLRG